MRVLISEANNHRFALGDTVRVLLDDFVLGGRLTSVNIVGIPSTRDGIAVVGAEIQFDAGWAEYYLPVPTDLCTWIKAGNSEWIDWNDASNWSVGPIALDRPAEYPLRSAGAPQDEFPLVLAMNPEPKLSLVNDQAGQPSPELSSLVLSTDGFSAASDSLLSGCRITVNGFDETVRQNSKGDPSQMVTSMPDFLLDPHRTEAEKQADVNTLRGQQVHIRRSENTSIGTIDSSTVEETESGDSSTLLILTFIDPLPKLEWRLCALRGKAVALTVDPDPMSPTTPPPPLPPVPDQQYYFQIMDYRKLSEDGKKYAFTVGNLMLSGTVTVDGVEELIEFTAAPTGDTFDLVVPPLYSAAFNLTGLRSAAFYRNVDGGEIAYTCAREAIEGLSTAIGTTRAVQLTSTRSAEFYRTLRGEPITPPAAPEVLTTAVAVSRIMQDEKEQLHVAFFPPLNASAGFKLPPDAPVQFYPSFSLVHSPELLTEQMLRNKVPIHATVRVVVRERGTEFLGPLAPAVLAPMAKGQLALSPLDAPPDQPTPPIEPVYAHPGPRGSNYTLSWMWNKPNVYEFKVYRISADFIDKVRADGESDHDVLNDYLRVEPALSLRNRSQLREVTFTDVFESRGAGQYYYKVVALDKTGTACRWEDSLIIPNPERQGPLIVSDTVPPDAPTLKSLCIVNGKVQLEWQSNPAVDEYWIYRSAEGSEMESGLKLKVLDIDNTAVSPRLERVPIVAGTESEPIRCMPGTPPVLDLFWMPDMLKLIGIYELDEYKQWLAGKVDSLSNLYPGDAAEIVHVKHRDGSEEDKQLDSAVVPSEAEPKKPGLPLAIEYLTEKEARLQGYFYVKGRQIAISRSPEIAVLVGLYKIEGFDPNDPQCPLSGTLDLTGPYPVIRDIREGSTVVEDGYRPVILYKKVDSASEQALTIYGAYPVRNGTIELVYGPELPIVEGKSASTPFTLPMELAQPANAIVAVYKQSDYHGDQDHGPNLYNDSYDGVKISGIDLPDNEPVIIVARQYKVDWRDRSIYHSLRIEGYPQAVKVDAVTLVNHQTGLKTTLDQNPADLFDPANPYQISLRPGSITNPPENVVVQYTDDSGIQRNVAVVSDGDNLNIARSNNLPGGLAPYIADFLGVWRLVQYDLEHPDPNLELVVSQGNRMFRRSGSFIQVHTNASLPVRQNDEAVSLAIRFRDHKGTIHSVTYKPGWLRFTDSNPYMNTTSNYQLKAVKTRNYREDGTPKRLEIGSRLSQAREVTLMDSAPPVPPDLSYDGLVGGAPAISWPVVQTIMEYQLERKAENSPTWKADNSILSPAPGQSEVTLVDTGVRSGRTYAYRLRVRGVNGMVNIEFKLLSGIVIP